MSYCFLDSLCVKTSTKMNKHNLYEKYNPISPLFERETTPSWPVIRNDSPHWQSTASILEDGMKINFYRTEEMVKKKLKPMVLLAEDNFQPTVEHQR